MSRRRPSWPESFFGRSPGHSSQRAGQQHQLGRTRPQHRFGAEKQGSGAKHSEPSQVVFVPVAIRALTPAPINRTIDTPSHRK
ncbi:hypothetical protein FQ320_07085 [Oceaniovalibus sp. ACAM 378]|nr:hypothetical protein FQ320_07085 [Oceaniovalibus sp. ACAM 378]